MAASIHIVPKEIQDTFTLEQKEYLSGFLLAVAKRGETFFAGHTANGLITADAASGAANLAAPSQEEAYFGTPVEDLCKEERWKYEENPLDIWEKILAHARENRFPEAGDVFRFKFHGLFYVAPAQDSFMLRLRTPGSILTSHQMRGLAEMAEDWGAGEADITTRSNIQIRQFQPKDIVRVLTKVQSLGMNSRGTGADNIRNITATPTSGLDSHELIDVAPLAQALNFYILNSRDLYGLPRKFNVAFDSGGRVSVVADTNDIAFVATRVLPGRSVPEGVYFRVQLCGITGHRQFATDCGLLLMPEQAIAVAAAMIRVFNENGDRMDRKRARLKYLIDDWGVDKFLDEAEKRLAFPLLRSPLAECEPRGPVDPSGHLGAHPQRQQGLFYLGVAVPVGRLSVAQMRAIADIADEYGSREIRLTVWQNLILPNISGARLEAARNALAAAGLSDSAGTFAAAAIACTGNKGCRFSATDTKSHAVQLAQYLDDRFVIEQPLNLHVTGCPHSCAQHYIGDIGLLGTKAGGEEGYQVLVGGGSDDRQGLGRELISAIRFADLPLVMEKLFSAYTAKRLEGESFLDYTRRHEIEELKAQISTQEQA
ncbi:NirA family protein [Edaphobacter bradus]|uniref:NirA family protein n=1 Tax=Edaphobacter bradus TaxID=2259016 RepID=UPI0021E0C2DF|nr:NirA family protein [Edaphobacter bradus]